MDYCCLYSILELKIHDESDSMKAKRKKYRVINRHDLSIIANMLLHEKEVASRKAFQVV